MLAGCTTLLGDFEILPTNGGLDGGGNLDAGGSRDTGVCIENCDLPNGDGSAGCPVGQTKCGDTCVDTQTSAAHCGACNRACPNGLSCGGGNCQCPDQGAFCDGQCFPRTDKAHCGVTCIACASGQVCDGKCVDPPPPAFEKVPRSATGWTDAASAPLTVVVKATGQPGTKYECRSGPIGVFSPTAPDWKTCDGTSGDGTTHQPTEDATTPEGTYRTEYRYKLGPYTSPVIGTNYYVHKSLNGVATCPRQGVPLDGPHFTVAQYFAAAQAWASANAGFPIGNKFPDGGDKRSDAIYLGNPWIKIPFSRVAHSHAMDSSQGYDDVAWPPAGKDYLFNERSLRHRWVINEARTMILVARQYIHPTTNDCKQRYEIGDEVEVFYGPPGRGKRKLECEAYILNTQGNAICLMPSASRPEPEVIPVDSRIPGTAGSSIGTAFQTYANNTYVYSPTPVFTPSMAGGFIQIPEGPFSRWYKIASVSGTQTAYLSEPFAGGALLNQKARFTDKATPTFVIDTGYAKLHQDAHSWATGQKRIPAITGVPIGAPRPSPRTKCETPGCGGPGTAKPWLTYLPP
jgi:hypothetical protein